MRVELPQRPGAQVDRLENAVATDGGEVVGAEHRGVGRDHATTQDGYDSHKSSSLTTEEYHRRPWGRRCLD
ncbi:hypothetical protein Vau01_012850 [Virgisporangium aurantiacum]|uniref:Uncharacterized protein n=1 Tax=Virgisporangium aurantiacum TaxID=175570 RepID=A0A8J4DXC1_9ACTN|nr:hypothetical protein Vau01_012850 [Virgisporangium aurantiacum]